MLNGLQGKLVFNGLWAIEEKGYCDFVKREKRMNKLQTSIS